MTFLVGFVSGCTFVLAMGVLFKTDPEEAKANLIAWFELVAKRRA